MRQTESVPGGLPKSWRRSAGRCTTPSRWRAATTEHLACLKHPTLHSRGCRCAILISSESWTAPSYEDRMQGETMPKITKSRSEGVQIRLDPELKHEARLYLT